MKRLLPFIIPAICSIAMIAVVHRCNNPPRQARASESTRPVEAAEAQQPVATEVPTVEPTPEPTPVPTYYLVTLYSGATKIKSWRVTTDTKFEIFGTGVNFHDDRGKDITVCGTYTIEEE